MHFFLMHSNIMQRGPWCGFHHIASRVVDLWICLWIPMDWYYICIVGMNIWLPSGFGFMRSRHNLWLLIYQVDKLGSSLCSVCSVSASFDMEWHLAITYPLICVSTKLDHRHQRSGHEHNAQQMIWFRLWLLRKIFSWLKSELASIFSQKALE